MTRTTGHPNADLAQRSDRRCAMVPSRSEILRASSAFTRPQQALRSAITIASVVALMSAGTVPATAQDGDTAEGSLAEELASDAASEYTRGAKEGLDERQESDTRRQNRADQESREDGSLQERQEERAREEIKDAVTKAYLSGEDGSEAAENAADSESSSSGSDDHQASDEKSSSDESDESGVGIDVAIPGVKPNWGSDANTNETGTASAPDGVELGWGTYPGVGPDIYGAEVVGRLANQVLPSGPMGEAGNAMGAGYGGIFGSPADMEAPSASESGRMQGDGSDGIPAHTLGDSIAITDGEGNLINEVDPDDLDTVTGPDRDWHLEGGEFEVGELKITEPEDSDTDQETMEFGEEEAVGSASDSDQEGSSDEDEETMVFGEDETDSDSDQEDDNESDSDSGEEDSNEGDSGSESDSEASSGSDENSEEGEDTADKDEDDTLPAPGQRGGPPLTEGEKELVNRFDDTDEDIKRAANNSNTTMPAQPDGGKFNLDLPWGILNQLDKTTMPVQPGSMQPSAMPLPLSIWNPGYIDPHRGN